VQIRYVKGEGVALAFSLKELPFAVGILQGIYKMCGANFIKEAIDDIENDLKPKKVALVVHNHLCEKCFTMVNGKDENSLKMVRDGDVTWRHKKCPTLKKNRPN
jgi:hypothetical protein